MGKQWTRNGILELARSYQAAAVMAAAADLDLFSGLAEGPQTAKDLSRKLKSDVRGTTVLLDALAALGLANKRGQLYSAAGRVSEYLAQEPSASVLGMAQHQANCLRRWAQLGRVVKTGKPVEPSPSIRGETGDLAAFIGAMHNVSAPVADKVIRAIQPLRFGHLLDIGGGSGTWTIAFLRACPSATATLFDLPEVIPMAERRLAAAKLRHRVSLAAGNFMSDALPAGADLAWVSAIVHQNSRELNRQLFGKVYQALVDGGRIAIRDLLMESTRTRPVAGALFAVNMLVATEGGGTFTFEELSEDLEAAGFTRPKIARRDEAMNSVVVARKE